MEMGIPMDIRMVVNHLFKERKAKKTIDDSSQFTTTIWSFEHITIGRVFSLFVFIERSRYSFHDVGPQSTVSAY